MSVEHLLALNGNVKEIKILSHQGIYRKLREAKTTTIRIHTILKGSMRADRSILRGKAGKRETD